MEMTVAGKDCVLLTSPNHPRLPRQDFVTFFNAKYNGIRWRFTHFKDPVPHLALECVDKQL